MLAILSIALAFSVLANVFLLLWLGALGWRITMLGVENQELKYGPRAPV